MYFFYTQMQPLFEAAWLICFPQFASETPSSSCCERRQRGIFSPALANIFPGLISVKISVNMATTLVKVIYQTFPINSGSLKGTCFKKQSWLSIFCDNILSVLLANLFQTTLLWQFYISTNHFLVFQQVFHIILQQNYAKDFNYVNSS